MSKIKLIHPNQKWLQIINLEFLQCEIKFYFIINAKNFNFLDELRSNWLSYSLFFGCFNLLNILIWCWLKIWWQLLTSIIAVHSSTILSRWVVILAPESREIGSLPRLNQCKPLLPTGKWPVTIQLFISRTTINATFYLRLKLNQVW